LWSWHGREGEVSVQGRRIGEEMGLKRWSRGNISDLLDQCPPQRVCTVHRLMFVSRL
jgi:hypothetical protein